MSSCCFTPSYDGGPSLALVIFVRGSSPDRSHVEVLTSMGHGMYCAQDNCDLNASWAAQELYEDDCQDGLYVLECRWHGSGEDQEFLVDVVRPLNDEERECVRANRSTAAIVHAWLPAWAEVPCLFCGRAGEEHCGHTLTCRDGDAPGVTTSSYSTDDPIGDLPIR